MHLVFKTRQTLLRGGLLCNTSLFIKCALISHPGLLNHLVSIFYLHFQITNHRGSMYFPLLVNLVSIFKWMAYLYGTQFFPGITRHYHKE